jgi:hypothetical protein
MIPKTYQPYKLLSELQGDDFILVQNDRDLEDTLDMVSFPKKYRKDIAGSIVKICDGDYEAVWVTESGRYYDLSAIYHPLPFYRLTSWTKKRLPEYWLEDCPAYQRKE